MIEYTLRQSRLLALLRSKFPGPRITDALCNAEQVADRDGVTADDDMALKRCAAEAIDMTMMEIEGKRSHQCPPE